MTDANLSFGNADDIPEPDEVGVGSVSCRCGALKLNNMRGTFSTSVFAQCTACGDWMEALVVTKDEGGR